ncbi:MAG: HEAT repeat domain-containing protein, partial [Elusimicrobia bacterium]|nr:HEAT repeat domain-containing protein [Elusimicrobiota bacterium]
MSAALAVLLALAAPAAGETPPSRGEQVAALFKQGMAAKMAGEYEKALDFFNRALDLDPTLPGGHLARGLTSLDEMLSLSRMELSRQAEKDLAVAVDAAPRNPLALSALALVYALEDDPRCEDLVTRAAAAREQVPAYGYAAVGRRRLDGQDWKGAVAAYRQAYDAAPRDSPLREFIRRELIVVRDRIRLRRAPVEAPAAPTPPKFEPQPYLDALTSDDPAERAQAAQALGREGLTEAVAPLTPLLKDKSLEVRASALRSLGLIGASRAVPSIAP